jgi:hypothetical protein
MGKILKGINQRKNLAFGVKLRDRYSYDMVTVSRNQFSLQNILMPVKLRVFNGFDALHRNLNDLATGHSIFTLVL